MVSRWIGCGFYRGKRKKKLLALQRRKIAVESSHEPITGQTKTEWEWGAVNDRSPAASAHCRAFQASTAEPVADTGIIA